MERLLFLDCCVRGEMSRTLQLCRRFLDERKKMDPELQITVRKLYQEGIPAMDREMLAKRDELLSSKKLEDPQFCDAREFAEADCVLIGAPYWDYSFPACLKNYFERISVNGILFTYVEDGSVGLCRAGKLMYISTAGGFVPENGHMGELYVKQLCDFYGISQFSACCVQGLDIWGVDSEAKMSEAEREVAAAALRW